MNEDREPRIFVVATPIGNLEDMSPRARRILGEADIIAAEDTRETRKLLNLLGIGPKELVSYHDYGEDERAAFLLDRISREQATLALVSDAGTPCISDPGYRLVNGARGRGIAVIPIPGPSALTALASVAGLPTNRILFIGFLPTKPGPLKKEMLTWGDLRASVVFFESTRRLTRTLTALEMIWPHARVAIGRELTKMYEETLVTAVSLARSWAEDHGTLKGEVAVMVDVMPNTIQRQSAEGSAGDSPMDGDSLADMDSSEWESDALAALGSGATIQDLLQRFADVGLSRGELYKKLLALKKSIQ